MLWDIAEDLERQIGEHVGPGRPRECNAADVLLFEWCTWIGNGSSFRAVELEFADPKTWHRIVQTVEEAWPDHPTRRLSPRSPSRSQHARFRKQHQEFDEAVERLRAVHREWMARIAEKIGMFDPRIDSLTHPAKSNLVSGDATWMQAMYNAPPFDPETGEVTDRRHDPDALPSNRSNQSSGRYLVGAIGRTDHDHENLLLDLAFLPPGTSDATFFTDMAVDLFERLPGARGTIYDMAMHAEDIDRIHDNGRHAICKVQRTSKGGIANLNLGEHTFQLPNNKTAIKPVTALDGAPAITITIDDKQHLMPLVRRQTKTRTNVDGTATIYGIWLIPQHPAVPKHLRGGTTVIRQNSTAYEREHNIRRTRALRTIPENDPDFTIYGRRELNESLHNHAKQRLPDRRARCVGLPRQRINLHAYQAHLAIATLIAWHYRTGGDLTDWFGQWRPPPKRRLALAA